MPRSSKPKTIRTRSGQELILPTKEEEAAINRGIAADPDNPELTEEWFRRARPAREVLGDAMIEALTEAVKRFRGPQKAPTKELVSLRLDRDLIAGLRASGRGWQGRVNAILRKQVLKEDA